jgi:hypothetical protein
MATFQKVDSFVEKLAEKVFNLGSDTLTVALTNTAHTSSWTKLSDLTQVSYANLSSRVLTTSSSVQTSGVYTLTIADLILSASGTVGPFRYIYIYDDTATNDELICYFDYGSSITLASGGSITLDFDTTGLLTIT